jgi:hypothetical protein
MEEALKKIRSLSFGAVLAFTAFVLWPAAADAASLYFSPASGSPKVGSDFTVSVYISSTGQAMNAASGTVTFPSDKLTVTSISKSGSIFSLWVQEPSFSNSASTVDFEGIVLNPGYTGSGAKILSINFKAKAAGNAALSFSEGMILANDGEGTNIIKGMGQALFVIGTAPTTVIPEAVTPSIAVGAPAAPAISSSTHPDPNKWYAQSVAQFTWPVPKDATAVRLLASQSATSIPTVSYKPPIGSKTTDSLSDGIWYFSAQVRNTAGWGGISHFRFQIDTEKPERLDIAEIERKDPTDPNVKFLFTAEDKTSGIDHYEIRIDGGDATLWQDDGSHVYGVPVLPASKHTLLVKAVDRAGNFLVNSANFNIEPLTAPVITDYPKTLLSGRVLKIGGETEYPGAEVALYLRYDGEEPKKYSMKTDDAGKFSFAIDGGLSTGVYSAWAEVKDARGLQSGPGSKVTFSIEQAPVVEAGYKAMNVLSVTIPLIALILILIFLILAAWNRYRTTDERLKKIMEDAKRADILLRQSFDVLREDVREEISLLEKAREERELTAAEEGVIYRLRKHLKRAEHGVRKKIRDIEREAG